MAMIKMSEEFEQYSGSCGGNFFFSMRCGQKCVCRRRPRFKPPSPGRAALIIACRLVIHLWNAWSAIYESFVPLWTDYGNGHPTPNRKGDIVTLTGYNWFWKINIPRVYNGLDPVVYPPVDVA